MSKVHVVQIAREAKFTLARSFRDMIVGSFTNETIARLQRGQGIDPGGFRAALATMLVEHRWRAQRVQSSCSQPVPSLSDYR